MKRKEIGPKGEGAQPTWIRQWYVHYRIQDHPPPSCQNIRAQESPLKFEGPNKFVSTDFLALPLTLLAQLQIHLVSKLSNF